MKRSRSMEECRKVETWGSLPSRVLLANGGLSILTMHCQRLSQGFEVSLTHRLCFSLEVFLATLTKTLQSVLTQNKEAYNEITVWWETKGSPQVMQSCILRRQLQPCCCPGSQEPGCCTPPQSAQGRGSREWENPLGICSQRLLVTKARMALICRKRTYFFPLPWYTASLFIMLHHASRCFTSEQEKTHKKIWKKSKCYWGLSLSLGPFPSRDSIFACSQESSWLAKGYSLSCNFPANYIIQLLPKSIQALQFWVWP